MPAIPAERAPLPGRAYAEPPLARAVRAAHALALAGEAPLPEAVAGGDELPEASGANGLELHLALGLAFACFLRLR